MTPNNPKSVQPERLSPEEPVEELDKHQERPNPEKVSPSQRGRFLSAMDEKGKKGEKKVPSSTASVDESEEPETAAEGDIFRLSSIKSLKKERALTDASGGESESYTAQKDQKQASLKSAAGTSTTGTQEQQLLALQAVANQEASREASRETASHKATLSSKAKMVTDAQSIQNTPESQPFAAVDKDEKKRAPEAFSEYMRPESMSRTKVDTSSSETQKKAAPTPVQAFSEAPQTVVASRNEQDKVPDTRATLLEIIKQTIDALAILKTKEESTVTISIKNPPVFSGATLKIVESTTAKNEFNITFDNLTPEARRIIESQANQVHLQQALVEKGYTLRNVVIAPDVKFEPLVASVSTGKADEQAAQEHRYTESFDQDETSKDKSQK